MTQEELKAKASEIWNELISNLPSAARTALENAYNVELFGKRGRYDESGDRYYLKDSPKAMLRLKELINGKSVTKIEVKQVDEVDDLEYSRQFETECYGSRFSVLTIYFADNTTKRCYI